jgi:hypothetical protein
VVQLADKPNCDFIAGAHFDSKRALSHGRKHFVARKRRAYPLVQSQSAKARACEHERIVLAFVKLTKTRIDVPAQILEHKIAAKMLQL